MADITKCSGEGCDRKEQCYRYTAKDGPLWQSYFMELPVKTMPDGKKECQMFWNNKDYK